MAGLETKHSPFGAPVERVRRRVASRSPSRWFPRVGPSASTLLVASACCSLSCSDGCEVSWNSSSGSVPIVRGAGPSASGVGAQLANEPRRVSLIQLIATPEAYRDVRVQVVGYVVMEREGNAVYLHRDDFMQGIVTNAVWIDLQGAQGVAARDSGYAIVEGRFNPDKKGHMALFSGAIEQVERLSALPNRDPIDASGKRP